MSSSPVKERMRSLLVLAFCIALAAATVDSLWGRLRGVGGRKFYFFKLLTSIIVNFSQLLVCFIVGTGWAGGRLMGDTGIDDDINIGKYRNLCKFS